MPLAGVFLIFPQFPPGKVLPCLWLQAAKPDLSISESLTQRHSIHPHANIHIRISPSIHIPQSIYMYLPLILLSHLHRFRYTSFPPQSTTSLPVGIHTHSLTHTNPSTRTSLSLHRRLLSLNKNTLVCLPPQPPLVSTNIST